MSMYFEFKTISEIIGDSYYRQQKQFTLDELAQYDGSNGKPAYVAVEGIVYDVSKVAAWAGGIHFGLKAGKDLTEEFNSCHGMIKILNNVPKVGILVGKVNAQATRRAVEETYDFSPDDWVGYITPLVTNALQEANLGVKLEHLFQKFILIGVLVGQGRSIQEATNQVEAWEKSGISQLLDKSRINRGYHKI